MTSSRRAVTLSFGFAMLVAPVLLVSGLRAQDTKPLQRRSEPAAPVAKTATTATGTATEGTPDRSAAYYHYGLAKIYEQQALSAGRQDAATQAIEQYKLALAADPDSTELQNGMANLYFRLGRIREAVSAAQDLVNRHPDDASAHLLLGRVYLRSLDDRQGAQPGEMLGAAIKEYETLARLKPNDLETRLLLGQLYELNHDSAKAEEQLKAAQAIDGNSEDVQLGLARLYSEEGDFDRAAKVLSAIPADDRSPRENLALAGLYDQLKQPKKAADAYQAALQDDPENTDARRGLAASLLTAGQLAQAEAVYQQLLNADPRDAQALIRIADIQRSQGKYEQALANLKKAEPLAPDNLELRYNEALDFDSLGQFDNAIQTLKQILVQTSAPEVKLNDGERSNRALFLDRLAVVYREAGHTDEAVATYKQIGNLGSDYQDRALDGEIETLRDAHQWPQALAVARAGAEANPKDHAAQLMYASQLADAGKLEPAMKLVQAQLNGTADDRDALITLADIYSRAKRWNEAMQAVDKAEALATRPEEKLFVLHYRGALAQREKLYDVAESNFQKGLAIDPDNAAIHNDYGYMLADRGMKLDQAVAMIKKAVDFEPLNGAYLDSLAWAYYKSGQYGLAEEYGRRAVLREGTDPSILAHMGDIYAHNGKLPQAVAEWEKSLKEYATSLPPEADPADVHKVQKSLDEAKMKLAHAGR